MQERRSPFRSLTTTFYVAAAPAIVSVRPSVDPPVRRPLPSYQIRLINAHDVTPTLTFHLFRRGRESGTVEPLSILHSIVTAAPGKLCPPVRDLHHVDTVRVYAERTNASCRGRWVSQVVVVKILIPWLVLPPLLHLVKIHESMTLPIQLWGGSTWHNDKVLMSS